MSSRLREIARQTVAIAESGRYRNNAGEDITIEAAVRAASTAPASTCRTRSSTLDGAKPVRHLEVTYESTLQAARRLGPGAACLVFASAKNPGGGFLGGAKAQEESIARASALYPCLLAAPDFYAFHRGQRDLRYSDRVVYSPGVPVFRDDKGNLLDRPYTTSFLTAAAPNLGAIVRNQPERRRGRAGGAGPAGRRVLEVAAATGIGQWCWARGGAGCSGTFPATWPARSPTRSGWSTGSTSWCSPCGTGCGTRLVPHVRGALSVGSSHE